MALYIMYRPTDQLLIVATSTIVNNVVLSDSNVLNMNMILELLYFKQNIGDLTLFSKEEIDFMIKYCCIN